MSGNLKQVLGLKPVEDDSGSDSQPVGKIAKIMSFSGELIRLMQLTRVKEQDINRHAVLFALNSGRFRSKVLQNYQLGTFSLLNSHKGKSRDELIEIVKASQPQIPKGFLGRLGDAFKG